MGKGSGMLTNRGYGEENPRVATQWQRPGFVQGEDHPLLNVSWKEAKAFCRGLTKRTSALATGGGFFGRRL
jgi:formylglycine-generating enzyme required for sulfatase activity